MFGILKYQNTCESLNTNFRQSYCGTCKTIGRMFGQTERLFLNFDIVFLNELISSLEHQSIEKHDSIIPFNCFKLPKSLSAIPDYLKFSSSINIVLAQFKIIDNINDSKFPIKSYLLKIKTKKNFEKAISYLKSIGFDYKQLEARIANQFKREKQIGNHLDFPYYLNFHTEEVAKVTSSVFTFPVMKTDIQEIISNFSKIGYLFGQNVYLIDVLKDYHEDIRNKNFNILLNYSSVTLSEKKLYIEKKIQDNICRIIILLKELPFGTSQKSYFTHRIASGFDIKSINIRSIKPKGNTLQNIFNAAKTKATHKCDTHKIYKRPVFYLYFLAFLILFILFPFTSFAQTGGDEKCKSLCGDFGKCVLGLVGCGCIGLLIEEKCGSTFGVCSEGKGTSNCCESKQQTKTVVVFKERENTCGGC
jgi:hypothetical protein